MTIQWISGQVETDEQHVLVTSERIRALDKHGINHHSPQRWLAIIGEEYGEACTESNEMDLLGDQGADGSDPRMRSRIKKLRHELAQTAAMCIHALYDLDGFPHDGETGEWPELPGSDFTVDPARWWMP